ncbi:hypothetical protein [Ferruginibacter sp. SUN106]|uniref:hypothetical protein n=1 Tax=Ferruginibacter sp. SUN106 TaxID=2978348 RepID=UPI003D35E2C8
MKKYYFLLLLLAPVSVIAQKKVDLDRFNFKVQFRSLPNIRLDSTYRTYNVAVTATKMMQPFMQDIDPANTVTLEGWRKLPQQGHLNIQVKLEDLLPESVSVKEHSLVTRDRNGAVTGTKTMYYQEVVYTFAATAQIADYKGTHIMDEILADRQYKQVYTSPEFAFKPLAEGYFVLNSLAVTKELYRTCVNKAMHYLSDRITDNFGFAEVTADDFMWVIGSRKHPEYEDDRKAFQLMNEVLFSMNASTSIESAREKLKPVIDYFENIKTTYSTSKKHDRKIRYSSYFNLAVLYYYLDDPEMMMKEANGLILNDFHTAVGTSFQQTATRLKNQFQQTHIYTRHFSIDPTAFKGPNEKTDTVVK